jgi:hypothetical protein
MLLQGRKVGKYKMKVVIKTNKKYGAWLARHLQREHRKTKGKIKLLK